MFLTGHIQDPWLNGWKSIRGTIILFSLCWYYVVLLGNEAPEILVAITPERTIAVPELDAAEPSREIRRVMAAEAKVFHLDEVSKHNNLKDCWLIISGKVYDVTKFLDDHPGGDEVLLAATGKDATEDFEDVGHSDSAKSLMEQYYIGDIDPSTIPLMPKYTLPRQEVPSSTAAESILKILQFLVPLLILGAAVGIHFYSN